MDSETDAERLQRKVDRNKVYGTGKLSNHFCKLIYHLDRDVKLDAFHGLNKNDLSTVCWKGSMGRAVDAKNS